NHAYTEALDAILLVLQDQSHLADLGFMGQLGLSVRTTTPQDFCNVVVGLFRHSGPKARSESWCAHIWFPFSLTDLDQAPPALAPRGVSPPMISLVSDTALLRRATGSVEELDVPAGTN